MPNIEESRLWDEITAEYKDLEFTSPVFMKVYQKAHGEGRVEGRVEGRAEYFLALLGKKFGDLSDEVKDQVVNADSEALDRWGGNILVRDRLEDVLD